MTLTKKHEDLIRSVARVEFELKELCTALAKVAATPRTNAKKLVPGEVDQIRNLWRTSSMSQREIAAAFDVNPATISRTVRGVYHR